MVRPTRPDAPDYDAMARDITLASCHDYIAMSEILASYPTATVNDWGMVFCSVSFLFAPDDDPPPRFRHSAADRAYQHWMSGRRGAGRRGRARFGRGHLVLGRDGRAFAAKGLASAWTGQPPRSEQNRDCGSACCRRPGAMPEPEDEFKDVLEEALARRTDRAGPA
jgi:hypothetical protein